MNSHRLSLICRVSVSFTILLASSIIAQSQCYLSYYGWKWPTNNVTYHINSGLGTVLATQQEYETAIRSAASQWNDAGSNFQFAEGDEVAYEKGFEASGIYQVGYYVGDSNDNNLMLTNVFASSGTITRTETYVNQFYPISANPTSNQFDLSSHILHEFGHWLDLADETNSTCSSNVMYYYFGPGDIAHRSLTDDDEAGIIALYGSSSMGVEDGIFIHSFSEPNPVIYTQNSTNYFWYDFSDQRPPNYIVSDSWSLLIEHGEGEYVASDNFRLGTLPYGYYWYRDADGNVLGRVKATAIEDDATPLTAYCNIKVSGIPPNTTSGTLSHNETWGDQNILTGSVTVPSGITLKILPGATVKFPSGASLTVNGVLNVAGIVQSPITFTSTGSTTPGSWGPLQLSGSGANGSTISYANIQYGTEVDINQASNVTIQNCNITDMSSNSIYLYFASNCLLQNNTIANSNVYHGIRMDGGSSNNCYDNVIYKYPNVSPGYHNGAGIMYSGCSGYIAQNDIRGYNWGIGCIWGASPDFYNPKGDMRNNRITDCLYGLEIYHQSYPEIGHPIANFWGNSIYNNSPYNVDYESGGTLAAEAVYWGGTPPIRFYTYNSTIDYNNYLTDDPWSGYPLPSVSSGNWVQGMQEPLQQSGETKVPKNDIALAKSAISSSDVASPQPIGSSLFDGIQLRLQNKYTEAKDFFISYLKKNPKDQAAYVELYNCYNAETAADIISYFESLPSSAAKEHKLLLANLYLMSQRDGLVQDGITKAKKVNDDLVSGNKNTALAEKAKLNKFYIALYNENDPESAVTILSDALSTPALSTDMELSDAQAALINYINPKTGEKPGARLLAKIQEPLPTTYGIDQNFPNPFNPSTTINYQLPENSHVVIKIYDLLGRDVRTLVNEDKPAGKYSVEFTASKLSSGIYFYTLRAGDYTAVKKMIVMK